MTEIEDAEQALRELEEQKRAAVQDHDVRGRILLLAEQHLALGGGPPQRQERDRLAAEYHSHSEAHATATAALDGQIADAHVRLQAAQIKAHRRQQRAWASGRETS